MRELVFADAWLLWVLVPLFLLWVAAWLLPWAFAKRRDAAVRFSSLQSLGRIQPSKSLLLRRLVLALRVVTVALLILAVARPQTGRKQTQLSTEGIDIVLVLDTSESMKALDLDADRPIAQRRNRLEVARAVVEEFVRRRENDQIGIVVFGNEAFTQCPLTLDHGIVTTFLEQVEIAMAGQGTAIGSGLGTAVKRLKDSQAKSKVIILLTDGRNNAGALNPTQAAEVAKTFGIKIYTIGAGTRDKAPFLVDSLFGQQVVWEPVDIDEPMLEAIARTTGGAYYRAQDREALASIYEQIDRLEKTEITAHTYMEYNELFRWFVVPALGLLFLEVGLLGTRLRKLP